MSGAELVESGLYRNAAALGDAANKMQPGDRAIAVLQGEQVAMRMMASPPRSPKKFGAAARYLLEDELGEAADDLHIATAGNADAGFAIAIKTSLIADWCDRFLEHGIDLDAMAPDYLCLPATNDGIFVLFEGGRTIAASPDVGFAIENEFAPIALEEMVSSNEEKKFTAVGDRERVLALLPSGTDHLGLAGDAQLLALFAEGYHARTPPNLLQGRFRKQREWKSGLSVWRRAAVIAAMAGVAYAGLSVAEGVRANRIAAMYEERATALHKQSFPDAAEIDPRSHARAILATGGAGARFLTISAKVAEALDGVDAVEIERIRYDAARGQFVLSIMSRSNDDIEILRRDLAQRGVSAEDSGGYRRSGDIWMGDMTVSVQ